MATQSNGTVILQTPAGWGDLSTTEFTTSFFVRVDAKEPTLGGRAFALQSNNRYYFWISNTDGGADAFTGVTSMGAGSNIWNEAPVFGLPMGQVVHVVISFSSVDTSKSFVSIDGVKYRNSMWDGFTGTVNLAAGWTFFGGADSTASHMTIEHVLLISRLLTDAEVADVHDDPIGTIPTLTAATKLYYPFTGPVGDDVADGDPGISISGDATRSLEVVSGSGTLRYAEPFFAPGPSALIARLCAFDGSPGLAF